MSLTSSPEVSAIVFVLNEEVNLPSCLDSLKWCDNVSVVDSFSTDATLRICESRNIPVFQHEFKGFGSQRNWALENLDLTHDWVLILDADERVTPELARELCELAKSAPEHIGAYRVKRRFYFWGKWLRYSSLYPTWVVRFVRRDRVRFIDRGHAETQRVSGQTAELKEFLIDENRKGLDAWLARQNAYSREEALFEIACNNETGQLNGLLDRDPMRRRAALKAIIRHLPFRGPLYFLYCYIVRLGFLDGKDGYMFCRLKAMYQSMIEIKKYDEQRKLR